MENAANQARTPRKLSEAASGFKTTLKTLKCPHCGGSISLHGGHNVRSIVCQYCSSTLDPKNDLNILSSPQKPTGLRPVFPLKVGQKGKLQGVDYVVIGIAIYEQHEDGEVYPWTEYLLFSYTHGYVYLNNENGHWVILHEVKDLPDTEVTCNMVKHQQFTVRDKKFTVFESSTEVVGYAVGEFTWEIKAGDSARYMDAICPPYMYCIEQTKKEIEYYWGEYVSHKEIEKAFGVTLPKPKGIGACQYLWIESFGKCFTMSAFLATIIAFLVYAVVSTDGTEVFSARVGQEAFTDGAMTKEFKVKKGELHTVAVTVDGLKNSWAFLEGKLLSEDEENEFSTFNFDTSYYHGVEDGESWTENNETSSHYMRVPEDATFKLSLEGEGGKGESNNPDPTFPHGNVTVCVYEGTVRGDYTLIWAVLLLVTTLGSCVLTAGINGRRFGSDDDD